MRHRYPSEYDDSIRKAGERFVVYLYVSRLFKDQWDRAILTQRFQEYLDGQGKCFNRVLYHLHKYSPSLLCVKKHTLVVFDKKATDRFCQSSVANEGKLFGENSEYSEEVLPGVKPKGFGSTVTSKIGFHGFSVPNSIRLSLLSTGRNRELMKILNGNLNHRWYKKKFATLLHVEELRQEEDMDNYRMEEVELREEGKYLCLKVPGLAENRPSLLRGDRLWAVSERQRFEGFVHKVHETEIWIRFCKQLHRKFKQDMRFDIEFGLNRHSLKMMHRALQLVQDRENSEKDILFPECDDSIPAKAQPAVLAMMNSDIDGNDEQTSAIKNIVGPNAADVYIVFGPPGTGKTITMVEAIHQVLRANSHYRVLVCAPSNSACDLIAQKLMRQIDRGKILRMQASSRKVLQIPADLKKVSNCRGDQIYAPDEDEFKTYQVIVCTLITAGKLATDDGIFDRIFVDESGQALEPELMVAIGGNLAKDGKVVIAGDPKQLGPIIRSPIARNYGLQLSYLERLMSLPMYQKKTNGEYDVRCVTKLLKNYRSHESIIKIPNDEFYEGELKVCADETKRNIYWSELPKKGFPVIFKAVFGPDARESDSPSFCNAEQIEAVKTYVRTLLCNEIEPSEIGIISPYRKQVHKIRQAIKNDDIKVGSVEEFQGQERRVIILSTVRSSKEYLNHDKKYNLGFLANPKRFNVAITRAQALLIVIGNPKILAMDECWRKFIKYCCDNDSCIGMSWEDVVSTLDEIELDEEEASKRGRLRDRERKMRKRRF